MSWSLPERSVFPPAWRPRQTHHQQGGQLDDGQLPSSSAKQSVGVLPLRGDRHLLKTGKGRKYTLWPIPILRIFKGHLHIITLFFQNSFKILHSRKINLDLVSVSGFSRFSLSQKMAEMIVMLSRFCSKSPNITRRLPLCYCLTNLFSLPTNLGASFSFGAGWSQEIGGACASSGSQLWARLHPSHETPQRLFPVT